MNEYFEQHFNAIKESLLRADNYQRQRLIIYRQVLLDSQFDIWREVRICYAYNLHQSSWWLFYILHLNRLNKITFQEGNKAQEELLRLGLVFRWKGKLKTSKIHQKYFTLHEIEQFLIPTNLEQKIFDWIGNHQILKHIVQELILNSESLIANEGEDEWLKNLITMYFLDWENGEDLQHSYLKNIQSRLNRYRKCLIVYRWCLTSSQQVQNKVNNQKLNKYLNFLIKLGLIVETQNGYIVSLLYKHERVFSENWVQKRLTSLRIESEIRTWVGDDRELFDSMLELTNNFPVSLTSGYEQTWVDNLVNSQIVDKWEKGEEDIHRNLRSIRNFILRNKKQLRQVLNLYKNILQNSPLEADNSQAQTILLESKLIKLNESNNELTVSNKLYKTVFDIEWIERQPLPFSIQQSINDLKNRIFVYTPPNTVSSFNIRDLINLINRPLENSHKKWIVGSALIPVTALIVFVSWLVWQKIDIFYSLESKGIQEIENFKNDGQLKSLIDAVRYGKHLEKFIKNDPPYTQYPAVSPIYALQYIHNHIYEKNQVSEIGGHIRSLDFKEEIKTDNKIFLYFVYGGDNGSLKFLKWEQVLNNEQMLSTSSHQLKTISVENIDQGILSYVGFLPNRSIIVTIGWDEDNKTTSMKFWTLSGNMIGVPHTLFDEPVGSVAFNHENTILATVGDATNIDANGNRKGSIKFWEVKAIVDQADQDQVELIEIPIQFDSPHENNSFKIVVFNPQNNMIITLSSNQSIKLWELNKPAKKLIFLHEIPSSMHQVENISFNQHGGVILAIGKQGIREELRYFDLKGNLKKCLLFKDIPTDGITSFSSDGNFISVGIDQSFQLYNIPTNEVEKMADQTIDDKKCQQSDEKPELVLERNNDFQGKIFNFSFTSPNFYNKYLAVASTGCRSRDEGCNQDKTIRLYDITKVIQSEQKPFSEIQGKILGLWIGRNANCQDYAAVQLKDKSLQLWDIEKDKKRSHQLKESQNSDQALKADKIALYRTPNDSKECVRDRIVTIQNRIINRQQDLNLMFWEFSQPNWDNSNHSGSSSVSDEISTIKDLVIGSNNKVIFIDNDGRAKLWHLERNPDDSQPLNLKVTSASFNNDGSWFITANLEQHTVELWQYNNTNAQASSVDSNFIEESQTITKIMFSPDDRFIAGLVNDDLKLWQWKPDDLSNQLDKPELIFEKLEDKVNDQKTKVKIFRFHPNPQKQIIATSGDNNIIKLWDYKGRQVAEFEGDWEKTQDFSFTADGDQLYAVGDDGTVQRWNLDEEINLTYLVKKSCQWLDFYIKSNPDEAKSIACTEDK